MWRTARPQRSLCFRCFAGFLVPAETDRPGAGGHEVKAQVQVGRGGGRAGEQCPWQGTASSTAAGFKAEST